MSRRRNRFDSSVCPSLLQAVEAIYDCIPDPSAFDSLPTELAPALGVDRLTLWCFNTDLETVSFGNFGLDESARQEYFDTWANHDAPLNEALQSYAGKAVTPEFMFGTAAYRKLPVFEGFYEPNDMVHQMGRFDVIEAGWIVGLGAQRGAGESPISQEDLVRLETMIRHLRRAWLVTMRMGLLSTRTQATETLLSRCSLATWLLDTNRYVQAQNSAADDILSSPDAGITVTRGIFRFLDSALEEAFRQGISVLESGRRVPVELSISARARRSYAWGVLIPLEGSHNQPADLHSRYMLVLAQPCPVTAISGQQLSERLSISRAEADVLARLMQGQGPEAIANARGSTLETIRSYEKSLRRKLDCHSRASLISQGWQSIAAIPLLAEQADQQAPEAT